MIKSCAAVRAALFLTLCLLSSAATPAIAKADDPTIQVRDAAIRKTPSALGQVAGKVTYGEKVRFVEDPQGGWIHVARLNGGVGGWLRESAVAKQGFSLKAGDTDAQSLASSEELAFAAKGMDEVEHEFARSNTALVPAYAEVDRLEASPLFSVSSDELLHFLKQGELRLNQDFSLQDVHNE